MSGHTLGDPAKDINGLQGHIASSDLLNPSDALDLLAQVADLEQDDQPSSTSRQTEVERPSSTGELETQTLDTDYPPMATGALSLSDASYLLKQ